MQANTFIFRSFNKLEMVDTALSPTGKALNLGPGRLWGDVLEFAPPETYSYPHGQCRSVGVGGYLLGGGVNWLGTYNKYGYGAEHVLKMKVRYWLPISFSVLCARLFLPMAPLAGWTRTRQTSSTQQLLSGSSPTQSQTISSLPSGVLAAALELSQSSST